ncbi:pilus assembly protein [Rhizobium sp. CG5]|uniref:TadE/TadG family type IV pilus assembly protein n=1 Tax=Rhizobium sp. CG5 TaxID=2726076 RepID=UPI0020347E74|nr:TadE/TadG family type IV pilus assembly protein [Rhizobium sp. CG5]MCM2473657.1 pilus assembly protein [Rhizobium sp. CG5]
MAAAGYALLKRLKDNRDGIGGVEFALIVPLLLVVYICAFELTLGFSVAKRATRATGTIADLVAQQSSVTTTFLATMPDVAAAIFTPYDTAADGETIDLKITGIAVDSSANPTVAWSWAADGTTPYVAGTTVSVPSDMVTADVFMVRAELSVPHTLVMYLPGAAAKETRSITIEREYFFQQRTGETIDCSDC